MNTYYEKFVDTLLDYSLSLEKNEKVLIASKNVDDKFISLIVKKVYEREAIPIVQISDTSVEREILLGQTKEQVEQYTIKQSAILDGVEAYLFFDGTDNINEIKNISHDQKALKIIYYNSIMTPKILSKKWCISIFPNKAYAQASNQSFEEFYEAYFKAVLFDYKKMAELVKPLEALLAKTDKVCIKGNGTDISFSIKGIGVVPCVGLRNIPDGEVYTAPVKDSVNGVIRYNIPSRDKYGITHDEVVLTFKDGKVVSGKSTDQTALENILSTDEGARYIGEFALGINPCITEPMNDILFDEKIFGSFHFTLGNCYDEADNGNKSLIHWDLVVVQTKEFGGGEMYFDDVLVRKDGKFVLEELKELNFEKI